MAREVSRSAVLVVASAVAVVAASVYLVATWPPAPPGSEPLTQSPGPSPSAAAEETTLVVLGDSFSNAAPASNVATWPVLLGEALEWEVSTNATDGSGYVVPGEGRPFGQRVRSVTVQSPDVVLVAGGAADVGTASVPRVARNTRRVVTRLVRGAPDTRVVLVSPFSSGPPGPLTLRLSASLRQVARDVGVGYVDAARWLAVGDGLVAPDGVHPTARAHRRVANRMARALARLGVADGQGQAGS